MPVIVKSPDERGSIFIMALIAAGLVSVVALLITGWHGDSLNLQRRQKIKSAAVTIQQRLLNQIYNAEAWKATAGANACLLDGTGCVAGAGGWLTLKNSDGSIFYDPTNPTEGFNFHAARCSLSGVAFAASGNDACPFRYDLKWSAANCVSGKCQIRILGEFLYRPAAKENAYPFSPDKWNLNFAKGFETGSLQASCNSIGGAFDQATLTCKPNNNQIIQCPDGQIFHSVDSTQVPVCDQFALPKSCPNGRAARGIASNGTLNCVDPSEMPTCVYSRTETNGSACTCTNGTCTQAASLIWVYSGTEVICNKSNAMQICKP